MTTVAHAVLAEATLRPQIRASVIVTLYNYRRYILGCLQSVFEQTVRDLELIVVDDSSTDAGADGAIQHVRASGDRYSRFMVIRHESNQGLAHARNTAFAHARGPYVFVLDADNLLYPRCIEQLSFALDHCSAGFAYSYVEQFGSERRLHNIASWDPAWLRQGNRIDAMVLLRRSEWHALGGYSTTMPRWGWEDFDLWFKIARRGGWGVRVPEILARYRVHGESMLRTHTHHHIDQLWEFLRTSYPEFFVD